MSATNFKLAAKCAPEETILERIREAGLSAVELFTNGDYLSDLRKTIMTIKKFPFKFAVHAPNDVCEPELLAELVGEIGAEVVVFHDIFWDDEWEHIVKVFRDSGKTLCVENVASALDPMKLTRRFGLKYCLDIEHIERECAGIFEESFISLIQQSSHIHMTGYFWGSDRWHTHIHQSAEHSSYLLNCFKKANYTGLVISEAKNSLQTHSEFKKLHDFFQQWQDSFS